MQVYFYNRVGNLGNCIFSLTNIIHLCLINNSKFSTDLSQFWKKIPYIEVEKIPFFIREFDVQSSIKSDFFRFEGCDITKERRQEIVEKYIKPYVKFNIQKLPETTCLINIRSGDIFNSGGTHKNYIQPPFAFYQKIIDEELQYDRFLVVTQPDLRNPTISLVKEYSSKVEVITPDVSGALSFILGASSIIGYYGTFLQVLFFSENIKKFYTLDYADFFNPFGTCKNAEIIRYKFLKPYISVGSWINSQEQIEIMKKFSKENIIKE